MKDLIIVESPTKARTIKKLLGGKVSVLSSKGHVKDLPKSRLGIEMKDGEFIPEYIKIRGKAKELNAIKAAARKSKKVLLAPDPDREGEAIAQHLAEEIDNDNVLRVRFYEITKKGIEEALSTPGAIDELLVQAQSARRVLDRLVGYKVSPLLWKLIRRGLSAGRVQSVALRILCEREKEISEFKSEPYWVIKGEFEAKGERFEAELVRIRDQRVERIGEDEMKEAKEKLLPGKTLEVARFEISEKNFPPLPPFKTSTLQQEAASVLGFTPRRTMRVAQGLYEGVNLGDTTVGLVTYMRTDSLRVAPEFITATRGYISETMGEEWSKPHVYKDKSGTQGAHEAIRPTGLQRSPELVSNYLERDAKRLYDLVWRRYLASQMADARYEQRVLEIACEGYLFRTRSAKRVFEGYERIYAREKRETDFVLPKFDPGDKVTLLDLSVEKKETQPPPRYTEASLIRKLEANGIGRPSTYASIVDTLSDRQYTSRERSTLIPTELGMLVNGLLVPRFEEVFNVQFTKRMEDELDQVAEGKLHWQTALREFWQTFSADLERVESQMPELKEGVAQETDEVCPKCGKPLVQKWGRYGKFLACTGFPECRYTRPLGEVKIEETSKRCETCGAPMVVKVGRFGRFLACSRYPECKTTSPYVIPQPCPLCGSEVLELRGKRGKFYKCSSENCVFVSSYPLSDDHCPVCNANLVADPKESFCVKCHPEKIKPRNSKKPESKKKKD